MDFIWILCGYMAVSIVYLLKDFGLQVHHHGKVSELCPYKSYKNI